MRVGLTCLALTGAACAAAPPPADSARPLAQAPIACGPTPSVIGQVRSQQLNEISGIVESHTNPGVFFVHNDSGDSPRFFALDSSGVVLAELVLEGVSKLLDAEDIASGPAPGGDTYLYLGDTGNNFASMGLGIPRRKAVLYRVLEPALPRAVAASKLLLRGAFPIVFTFPDGARDVEALFIDPRAGDLYMISRQSDGQSQVLSASAATLAAGGGQLRLEGTLVFGRDHLPGSPLPSAASISRDGSVILVRTYDSVFAFRRAAGESVMSALGKPPLPQPSPREAQGEAIGFASGDAAFVTVSEGLEPAIHCVRLALEPKISK